MKRAELLNQLIELKGSVDTLINSLEQLGWDSTCDLVVLKKEHLLKILNCYIEGTLGVLEVEKWANAIESREDIGFEVSSIDLIKNIIYELANPALTESLTKERAKILQIELSK